MTSVNRGTTQRTRRGMSFGSLVAFFALTFGLAWGIDVLLLLFTAQIEATFGPVGYTNPVFILIVWTPGLVGVFLVFRHYGLRGLLSSSLPRSRASSSSMCPSTWALSPATSRSDLRGSSAARISSSAARR